MNAPDLEEDMRPDDEEGKPATTETGKKGPTVSASAKNNVFIG